MKNNEIINKCFKNKFELDFFNEMPESFTYSDYTKKFMEKMNVTSQTAYNRLSELKKHNLIMHRFKKEYVKTDLGKNINNII